MHRFCSNLFPDSMGLRHNEEALDASFLFEPLPRLYGIKTHCLTIFGRTMWFEPLPRLYGIKTAKNTKIHTTFCVRTSSQTLWD